LQELDERVQVSGPRAGATERGRPIAAKTEPRKSERAQLTRGDERGYGPAGEDGDAETGADHFQDGFGEVHV